MFDDFDNDNFYTDYTARNAREQQPYGDMGYRAPEQPAEQKPQKPVYQPVSPKQKGKANIVVVGIGGGGCNAVNNMYSKGITSATFVVMNTDLQALNISPVPENCKIQLGENTTQGLGAGSDPSVGKAAAEESRERIKAALEGVDLLFITAGMGGGTGTGAAPVVAEIARDLNILTVGVVTKPFVFEGVPRMRNAEEGIAKLKEYVDTLLIIPNQKLTTVFGEHSKTPFMHAFAYADDVLRQCIQGVSDVIVTPGLINLDFADVRTILSQKGLAHMGIGSGKGEKRVLDAVRGAIYCPLLENDIEGATALLINIIGGEDMTLNEVQEACTIVTQVTDPNAVIIFGAATRPESQGIEITIIATGFNNRKPPIRRTTDRAYFAEQQPAGKPAQPQQPVYQPQQPVYQQPRGYETQSPMDIYRNPAPTRQEPQKPAAPEVPETIVQVPPRRVPLFMNKLRNDDDRQ